ncbi:uncharacterized protein CANTADRAFT_43063, partial [Suhomyces tanzawaensis NRRL Y-17324]
VALAAGKQVSGVFKSLDSFVYQMPPGSYYPNKTPASPTWFATLSWEMDSDKISPGDTFTLTMPYVFKFISTTSTIALTADGDTYATCNLIGGELVVAYSSVECTATNSIKETDNIKEAFGTLKLPLVLNTGSSANSVDLEAAKVFNPGTNTVTFRDGNNVLSTTATFEGGNNNGNIPSGLNFNTRVLPNLNLYELYLLAGDCPDGYASGTLGIAVEQSNIDCETVHAGISNNLNGWLFPKSFSKDFQFKATCSPTGYQITYSNIPAGYRPFIDMLSDNPAGSTGLFTRYTDTYTCKSGKKATNDDVRSWGRYQNSDPNSNGGRVKIITVTYTGSTTSVTTLPFSSGEGNTRTVVVDVPVPTTTITSTWSGLVTTSITRSATPGQTATVIVEVPSPVVTRTTAWTGTITTTTTARGTDGTNTVIIETPVPATTYT